MCWGTILVWKSLQLRVLGVYPSAVTTPISPEVLALHRQPLKLPFSTNLISLVLAIETGYVYIFDSETWPKTVTSFILQFPSPEMFEFVFEPWIKSECFRAIRQALSLSHILTLALSTVSCTEGDLTQLFLAHQATLQEVAVDTVNLIHAGGSWRSFLTSIRDELRLAKFFFFRKLFSGWYGYLHPVRMMRLFLLLILLRSKLVEMSRPSTTLNRILHATVL